LETLPDSWIASKVGFYFLEDKIPRTVNIYYNKIFGSREIF